MKVRYFIALTALPLVLLSACSSVNEAKKAEGDVKELYSLALFYYQDDSLREAEATFKTVMEYYPLSPYSVEAQLMLGDVYYALESYEEARSYYTTFATLHPSHKKAPYALFQKGMCYFKELLTIDRDQTTTRKVLFTFQDFINTYPESPYVEKASELVVFLIKRLAENEFYVGKFYFRTKNYRGALLRFEVVLKDYPNSGFSDKALYFTGECYRRLGDHELARNAYTTLVKRFPESPLASIASYRLLGS
jgi:outer membrane protein assembly factor BamD